MSNLHNEDKKKVNFTIFLNPTSSKTLNIKINAPYAPMLHCLTYVMVWSKSCQIF